MGLVTKLPFGKILQGLRITGIKLLLIPLIGLVLLAGVLLFAFTKSTANITINLTPKEDQKTQNVTFSSGQTDIGNNVIASEISTVSEDGSIAQTASGKKDVGDKAKGKVTVFSVDPANSKTFPAQTVITSSDGKEFTIDSQISLAAADPTIGPSKTDVNVTASDIGQDYNLPSGTKFSLGSDSLVAAKNDNAFSGGNKKQVTIVSKDDVSKAEGLLVTQLEQKAKDDLKQKTSQDNEVLPEFIETSLSNSSQDKKINDQASQFTLKATVTYKGVVYKKSDILSLADSLFKSSNLTVDKNNFTIEAKNIKEETNGVSSDVTIKAKLIPEMDTNSLKNEILGFPVLKAHNLLANLPQVSNVSISISPKLPFFSDNLPKNPGKINITVVSQ